MNLLDLYSKEIEILKNNNNILAMILFGSYSKNQQNELSDLDLCLILKKNISKKEKEKILSYSDEKLDINILEEMPLSLQYKTLITGKIIKSKIDIEAVKRGVRKEWFDFRPILNNIYESKGLLPII